MNARRHDSTADDSSPEAHVTNRTCLSRRWCGWFKWSVMGGMFVVLVCAAGWLILFDLGTRDMAHAQGVRLQAEETKSAYVERDIGEIKTRLMSIDTEIKAIRTEQAAFFGKAK